MKLRLRLEVGPRVAKGAGKNRRVAAAAGALLWPVVLSTYSLALWALAAQMQLTADLGIRGVFSHWQVWVAIAIVTNLTAMALARYARTGDRRIISLFTWFSSAGPHSGTEPRA